MKNTGTEADTNISFHSNIHSYDHTTVLLKQAVDALALKPDGIYIDATFGRGGHSKLILERLNQDGKLIVIDKDPVAIESAHHLALKHKNLIVYHGSFKEIHHIVKSNKLTKIDGILFDLGVSSPQLDNPERGFSFSKDGPLDMRMDNSLNSNCKYNAEEWINSADVHEISEVLWMYGEERFSKKIANAIALARKKARIVSTLQLAEIIKLAHPKWPKNKHPATQSFLAIRLFINQELEDLESGLTQSLGALSSGGRLVIITFHSLEDRIVKNFLNNNSGNIKNSRENFIKKLPLTEKELAQKGYIRSAKLKIISKPLKACTVEDNIRARSAILRIAERTASE